MKKIIFVISLIITLFILVFLYLNTKKYSKDKIKSTVISVHDSVSLECKVDSTNTPTYIADKKNPVAKKIRKKISKKKIVLQKEKKYHFVKRILDTIPPYVYANPSGGFFNDTVRLELCLDDSGVIYYKTDYMFGYAKFSEPIIIDKNCRIKFYAVDTAGNQSVVKSENYDIIIGETKLCPNDMVAIKTGKDYYCIDRYEWPNKKGKVPQTMISFYAAKDSCISKDKRLCTSDEWYLACSAPNAHNYSYGNVYEKKACNTEGSGAFVSGSFPECRSYYGTMDMSGNVREWTSTPAGDNNEFYRVHGGFWESSTRSSCKDYKYSFYPENKHFSVGFRCCKDGY